MAFINGIPGKGVAVETVGRDGLRDRIGMLEMTAADAARLSAMCDADEELLYTGPVISAGNRHTETFPVLVRIGMSGATALVRMEQCGAARGQNPDAS